MQIGMIAERCNCLDYCKEEVEPMNLCIRRLPGETITAYCDVCDPTHEKFTWHNNGQCITCQRRKRDQAKQQAALRHQQILEAPANPVQIPEEVDYRPVVRKQEQPARTVVNMEIVLRVNGQDIILASDLADVIELIRHAPRH